MYHQIRRYNYRSMLGNINFILRKGLIFIYVCLPMIYLVPVTFCINPYSCVHSWCEKLGTEIHSLFKPSPQIWHVDDNFSPSILILGEFENLKLKEKKLQNCDVDKKHSFARLLQGLIKVSTL